nr:Stf0 family sulfotransferase [Altererythrobacter sp. KTW20L]
MEGITTGYEERFDFPTHFGPPRTTYLLASVPRSGSTWLSHVLWATGCLGAPLEYVNFEPGGPYGFAANDAAKQTALWRRAMATRTSPNGVFGLKTFPAQLHHVQQDNPALVDEVMRFMLGNQSDRKVVQLRRSNRDAHAISYARAMLRGIWRAEQEEQGGATEPEYSALAVERAAHLIDLQERAWQDMCRDLRIEPLLLWFEDAVADPAGVAGQVADYLGVALDPSARVYVPAIRQQSREGARIWAEQHAAR